MTPLEGALAYTEVGWFVFPIGDDTKRPITRRGYLDATIDPTTIREWWTSCPTARIGLALRPSGLIAVDVDVGPGKTGEQTFAALESRLGPLPRTNVQRSGNGGWHVVMRDPSPGPDGWTRPGGGVRGKLGPNVDLKCSGYVVVAPSGTYRWLALDPANVAEVPCAWRDVMRKTPGSKTPGSKTPGSSSSALNPAWLTTTRALMESDTRVLREMLAALGPRCEGASTTFHAITTIFHDYGLGIEDGCPFAAEWNSGCGAPRSDSELARQICDISQRDHERHGARGWRVGTVGHAEFLAWVTSRFSREGVKARYDAAVLSMAATLRGTVRPNVLEIT